MRSDRAGILLVDKPAGLSSAQVVSSLKKRLRLNRIGHAGTLDPFATGLLICLSGNATRLASVLEGGKKKYSGVIQLGIATTTDDITGEIISRSSMVPLFEQVEAAARTFVGEIDQVPPAVSAVKVDGVRAYKRARSGEEVSIQPRRVSIDEFSISPLDDSKVAYRLICSKGTYVRSIARDLGALLGCGAAVSTLKREASHPYRLTDAKSPDLISFDDFIQWTALFSNHQRKMISASDCVRLTQGEERTLARVGGRGLPGSELLCVREDDGKEWGLLRYERGKWCLVIHNGIDIEANVENRVAQNANPESKHVGLSTEKVV